MAVDVTLRIASCGLTISGSGTRVDANVVTAVPGECAHRRTPQICGFGRGFGLAGGGRSVGRDLARFHQHLEAAEVAARLDVRLALKDLRDRPCRQSRRAGRSAWSAGPPCRGRARSRRIRPGPRSGSRTRARSSRRSLRPGRSSVMPVTSSTVEPERRLDRPFATVRRRAPRPFDILHEAREAVKSRHAR